MFYGEIWVKSLSEILFINYKNLSEIFFRPSLGEYAIDILIVAENVAMECSR